MVVKTKVKTKSKTQNRNEMIKVRGKLLPRFAYKDTPQGTWREDRKTGRLVWRRLGNAFPEK